MRKMEQLSRQIVRCIPQEYQRYRYLLEVRIAEAGPRLTVILKNPSRAGATRSDPTVGKVEAWARRQGFGSLTYVNLFALRSTRPTPLNDYDYDYIVGPDNDGHIRQAALEADTVVAAWGNSNGIEPARYDRRTVEVLTLLTEVRQPIKVVGPPTRQGQPRHGLLWNFEPQMFDFRSDS